MLQKTQTLLKISLQFKYTRKVKKTKVLRGVIRGVMADSAAKHCCYFLFIIIFKIIFVTVDLKLYWAFILFYAKNFVNWVANMKKNRNNNIGFEEIGVKLHEQ